MKHVVYVKSSDKRSKLFRIQTIIFLEDGVKKVVKEALNNESQEHLDKMYENYLSMKRNDVYIPVPTTYSNGKIYFDFIDGKSIESILDECLMAKKFKRAIAVIKDIFKQFEVFQVAPYYKTDEFIKVFGEIEFESTYLCLEESNVDLIFQNLIVSNDKLYMIDYEWIFKFPIPYRYIMYRAIYLYVYSSMNRRLLLDEGIFEEFHFTKEEMHKFDAMEQNFQNYIQGEYVMEKKHLDMLRKGNVFLDDFSFENTNKIIKHSFIIFDSGEKQVIENLSSSSNKIVYMFTPLFEKINYTLEIPANCICSILRIVYFNGTVEKQIPYTSSMYVLNPNVFLSDSKGGSIGVPNAEPQNRVEIFIRLDFINPLLIMKFFENV